MLVYNSQMYTFRNLVVWQKSIELVIAIYELTRLYPKEEVYGLVSQTRRAAVSVPSNIAEGRRRGSEPQYLHFLEIALGSTAELETQLLIAKKLTFTSPEHFTRSNELLLEVIKMLGKMVYNRKTQSPDYLIA